MKAMVLAAGVGSRLQPITDNISKPMVPIVNKPVMEHIINMLKKQGIYDVIANVHYLGHQITDYFGDGSKFGLNIKYSFEEKLMGTAGGVKKIEKFFDDTFAIISGDALTDVNIAEVCEFHKKNKAFATICLKEALNVEKYGVVITDKCGKINRFQEKPKSEEALSNLVNTGIYIFEPDIFKYIPSKTVFDFGKELFPILVKKEVPFYGYKIQNYWNDIGSIVEYFQSQMDALCGKVDISFPGIINGKSWFVDNINIGEAVVIKGQNVIGENSIISNKVFIGGNVIIGKGCHIRDGTSLENVIILDNQTVPELVKLKNCIVCDDNLIKIKDGKYEIVKID